MSTENIMYIEIDQNKEFHNFVRFLEREFKCDGLFKFASPKEENPSITTTTEDIKLEPEVLPDSDHIKTDSEASQTTEAGKGVSKKTFSCDKCGQYKTKLKSFLLKHQKICSGGDYGCGLCGKKLKNTKSLRRHEKLTHGELKYWCDQCDYKGTREREFKQHQRRRHGSGSQEEHFTCQLCSFQSRYKQCLKEHIDGQHLNTVFPCQFCGKTFNTVKQLREHEKAEREGGLQCDKCWKNLPTRSALNKHMRSVHDPNKKLKTFVDSENEARQKMRHLGGPDWACTECDYRSNKSSNVYKHVESRHVAGRDYICQYCGKVLRNLNSYDNHIYKEHRDRTKSK